MYNAGQITISNISSISAIYFALLQCGYDFYHIERDQEHNAKVQGFICSEAVPPFFSGIKQDTCAVYPYWPRAAILETASLYLRPDHSQFRDYDAFHDRIMAAGNIADYERDHKLWDWIAEFPTALSKVLASDAFCRYLEWENEWVEAQNAQHSAELRLIQSCLDVCISKYGSPVQDIQIVINPIKCVCSADYHLDGNRFIFSSGVFRAESVIHEFLHHVIHPSVPEVANTVLANKRIYLGIDDSYYLSGGDAGLLNAFEEHAVREMTGRVLKANYPDSMVCFLKGLA